MHKILKNSFPIERHIVSLLCPLHGPNFEQRSGLLIFKIDHVLTYLATIFFFCKLDTLNMRYFLHDFITLLGWLKILVYACLIILSYSRPFRDFGKLELIRPSINFLDIWMIIETCKRGSLIFLCT